MRDPSKSPFTLSRRAAVAGVGIGGLGLALGARGSLLHASAQDATPAASDYPTVAVTAKDMEFLGLPASMPGGLSRISLTNEGPSDHYAAFFRLDDGSTPDDFLAAIESNDFGALLAGAVGFGGPSGEPGGTTHAVLDLELGRYMVVCLIPDEGSGMTHAQMGMVAPLEVTEAATSLEPPATDAAIDMADFAFVGLPSEVAAGRHVWAVTDTGEQPHELVLWRLAPGVPYAVAESIFLAPPPATPEGEPEATPGQVASPESGGPAEGAGPPFSAVGGIAPMSPGKVNYLEVEFDAGEYFAICFLADPETGAPHFALGMIMPFTVA